jgi:hypothetical protein
MGRRNIIGNGSSMPFRAREQDRIKREFQKIEGSDGTYVSKPGKDAYISIASNIFVDLLQEKSSI